MEESKAEISQEMSREENTSKDLFNQSAASAGVGEAEETKEEESTAVNPTAALALRKTKRVAQNEKNEPHITNLNEDP